MNKVARSLCSLVAAAVIAVGSACAHRPAYSEMNTNRAVSNQNQSQNTEPQATASTPAVAEPAPPAAAAKVPSFMDQGAVRDLPAYPNAYRTNFQLGPMEGVNIMSLSLISKDPMDKIVAFYEKVVKDNKWTVIDKIIDPEFSEWSLKKGEDNSAKVQVKKDQQTKAMNIVMVRGEKLEAPSK
jgi:hypothetical protein